MNKVLRKCVSLARKLAGLGYTDSCDEFLNWLLVSNAGMQHKGNVWCFERAINDLPCDAPLLEIGAHAGLSANIMRYLLRRHRRANAVISIDPWLVRGYDDDNRSAGDAYLNTVGGHPLVTRAAYSQFIRDAYLRNTAFFSSEQPPHAFQTTSDAFFEAWRQSQVLTDIAGRDVHCGGALSFCYIDGNHDYDFVRRDFENTDRHLAVGGHILFDDSADDCMLGSGVFARELDRHERYQRVGKNPNRLFKKIG